MTPSSLNTWAIDRRKWLLFAGAALAGCGGAEDFAALPGTGGTGIFAQGPISGFGSVIVNGIQFDDLAAVVQINGRPATAADLRLGMVAEVQGLRGADTALGTASQIDVWSIAQGLVERVQSSGFVVAGMEIQTDSSTVFDGMASAAELRAGLPVAVWGLQAGADGYRWIATRVAVVANGLSAIISTGIVSGTTALQKVNGLPMGGPFAPKLLPQQLVRVEGPLTEASLRVDAYRVLDLPANAASRGELEIEGVVTAVLAEGRFVMGNQLVDASTAKFDTASKQVTVGMRVEVHGNMQGQTLKALSVEFQSSQKLDRAEISAKIEQFTSLADFVVRGQRCNASAASIKGKASDLKVGAKVKLEGTKAGDVLMVTRLEIDD